MREGWKIKSLNDICEKVFAGGDVPKNNLSKFKTEKYTIPIYANGATNKGLYGYTDIEKVTKPSITVSARGTIGYSEIRTESFFPVVRLIVLTPNSEIISLQFLKYVIGGMDFKNSGTSIPQLTVPMIKKYQTAIPPLTEQKQIVAILDKAFAAIDKAKANTKRSLQNAKELFQSKFNQIFSLRDKSWIKYSLLELIEKGWILSHLDGNHGGDYPRKHEFVEMGVPYLSANCLKNGYVDFSKSKFLTPDHADRLRKGIAINNDVLFAHNATVGPTALLLTKVPKVILGTSLTYYRCNTNYIEPEYLLLYLRSKTFSLQYEAVMKQSTRNQVPITKQREFYHLIPPLTTQRQIIPVLKRLNSEVETININYIKKLNALEELKKSILQKAFAGELTEKEISI